MQCALSKHYVIPCNECRSDDTKLKVELPGYGTIWFDPQAITNVLSFGNIAKQYPVQYLQESDTFQVHLSSHINIFGHEQVDKLYILEGNQP